MKKLSWILSILASVPTLLNAQYTLTPTVIASSGDVLISSNYILSFTMGEAVIETFETGDKILTQGFQQPMIAVDTTINTKEAGAFGGEVLVYPNPTKGLISVDIRLPHFDAVDINLYDASGKRLKHSTHQVEVDVIEINIQDLPNGLYALEVLNCNTQKKVSFKVIKN